MRRALLALEKDVHVNEGWDAPPRVFVLVRNQHSGRVSTVVLQQLSAAILAPDEPPPRVLDALVPVAEWVREVRNWYDIAQDDGAPHLAPPEPPRNARYFHEAFRSIAPTRAEGDLFDFGIGQEFHGFGFLLETWWTSIKADLDNPEERAVAAEAADLAAKRELYKHPMRIETRQIEYSGRDGLSWSLQRPRRTAGIAVPRACYVHTNEDDFRLSGTIIEATTRICNAIASNPVPVRKDITGEILEKYVTVTKPPG